jgi:2Fe-2S ferredoxin
MPTIIFIAKGGQAFRVLAHSGQSIMDAATRHKVPGILGDCGGCVACGTCEATIDEVWSAKLPAQRGDELELIGDILNSKPHTRLTCQIPMTDALDGIVVHLP